jgi:hypothetical protein
MDEVKAGGNMHSLFPFCCLRISRPGVLAMFAMAPTLADMEL